MDYHVAFPAFALVNYVQFLGELVYSVHFAVECCFSKHGCRPLNPPSFSQPCPSSGSCRFSGSNGKAASALSNCWRPLPPRWRTETPQKVCSCSHLRPCTHYQYKLLVYFAVSRGWCTFLQSGKLWFARRVVRGSRDCCGRPFSPVSCCLRAARDHAAVTDGGILGAAASPCNSV
jgi:hypothetical protein